MRIIAGRAGRMAIQVPSAVARPTTDFVRQAVFSILGERVIGARVLDLFAGSGALGLEALSRGADSCVFVDRHRQSAGVISANIHKTHLAQGRVVKAAVADFLRRDAGQYDLVFADPPYWRGPGEADELRLLLVGGLLEPRVVAGGFLIAECSTSYATPEAPEGWLWQDRREYGSSAILLYERAGGG